jgi:hypothetical protein
MWPLPLLGLLHAESGAVVAALAYVVAGTDTVRLLRTGGTLRVALRRHLALLAVPLALLTLSLLWRANCGYAMGLGLFAVFVPPSAVLGVAVAYAAVGAGRRRPVAWVLAIGSVAAVGGVASDLGAHPQLFTYNHIFGGVLGPIYDEELAVRPGLFAFRALTLLWAAWAVALGRWLRHRGRGPLLSGAGLTLGIGAAYLFAVPLGFQQTEAHLARTLGGERTEGLVRLHYDPGAMSEVAVARAMDEAQFRMHQATAALGVSPAEPVRIFLYPDAATKGALIGSRETSVVPVWLSTPQVHLLADQVEASLGHELVHVVVREVGMPVLRASPAVGLVEGIAVALEPATGLPTAEALSATLRDTDRPDAPSPGTIVRRTMDPVGFWTARAGLAYTLNGAFSQWLLDRHGAAPLREAYRTGRFDDAYEVPLDTLTARWDRHLATVEVTAADREAAAWMFGQPSLFESACPHHVPRHVRQTREAFGRIDDGQFALAADAFADVLRSHPDHTPAATGYARALAALDGVRADPGALRAVRRAVSDSHATMAALRAAADLHRLAGDEAAAQRGYARALRASPPWDVAGRALLVRRARGDAGTLRLLLATGGRRVDAAEALREHDAVWAALQFDAADQPERAWQVAAAWPTGADGSEAGTQIWLQARLAYRAGDLRAAGALAARAERAYRAAGERGMAAVAADLRARVRWRMAAVETDRP